MIYPEGTVVKDSVGRIGKVVTYHRTLDQYEVNFFMAPRELKLVPLEEPEESGAYKLIIVNDVITYTRKIGHCWFKFGSKECYKWPPFEDILECRKLD